MGEYERWDKAIEEYGELIPPHMIAGIKGYVLNGQPTGDFLTALFENNFLQSIARADRTNQFLLPVYAQLIYNATPLNCHGSIQKVTDWIELGGIRGMILEAEKERD